MSGTSKEPGGNRLMDWFWDLASDDAACRHKAGTVIVKFLIHAQGGVLEPAPKELCSDLEYSIKRLIRGLSSSRQSARQGFGSCLCEVLLVFHFISYEQVISLIDETTKITGAMKRAEERDAVFGKLFGYIALIEARRVSSAEAAKDMISRLLQLYSKKVWLHEIVIEVIISAMESFYTNGDAVRDAFSQLSSAAVLFGPLEELSASQLLLLLALQWYIQRHPEYRDAFLQVFSYKHNVSSLMKIDSFAPALISSCQGFPKLHRVWDYLLGGIFDLDEARRLPKGRRECLSVAEGKALIKFTEFMDKYLVESTQEKRGVAMNLAALIAARVPVSLLPTGLTPALVRCLVATRMNKKHTLFVIAGQTIDSIVGSAVDPPTRLALASTLAQHGSPAFDAKTGTKAVSTLLEGTDRDSVLEHVVSVCRIIGSSLSGLLGTPACQPSRLVPAVKVNADSGEDSDSNVSVAISGIAELAGLVKNTSLPGRSDVCQIAVAVLVRLSCFDFGSRRSTSPMSSQVTVKKGKKKADPSIEAPQLGPWVEKALVALEDAMEGYKGEEQHLNMPISVSEAASSRLLSCLADLGHVPLAELENSSEASRVESKAKRSDTVLDCCVQLLACFIRSHGYFSFHGYGVGNTSLDDDMEAELKGSSPGEGMAAAVSVAMKVVSEYHRLAAMDASARQRLCDSLRGLLGHGLFHVLTTTELSLQSLVNIIDGVVPDMLDGSAPSMLVPAKSTPAPSEDDEENEDESVQLTLFENCIELLSIPGDQHPIKGVRDAIKKVWSAVSAAFTVDYSLVVSAVEFISGEEGSSATEGEDAPGIGLDEEEGDEGSDVEGSVDSQAEAIRAAMLKASGSSQAGNSGSGKNKRKRLESDSESDEEEGSVEDAQFSMLAGDDRAADSDDDDDGSDGHLEHTEEADGALINMLQMRKQARKKSLLDAKRVQLLNRTRAIDVLDAIISRNSATACVLVPMFGPLLQCIKKCSSSTIIRSLQEGRAFESRLKNIFESRICKEKFHLMSGDERAASEKVAAEVDDLLLDAIKSSEQLLNSTEPSVRQAALGAFVAMSRAIISSGEAAEEAKSALQEALASAFDQLFGKKNSRVPVKLFHDLIERFPDYICETLMDKITTACSDAKTSFLRSESCKLLNVFIKKFKILSSSSQQRLVGAVGRTSYAVSQQLIRSSTADSSSTDQKAKRLRPIMELSKDMLKLILGASQGGKAIPIERKSIDSLKALTQLDSSFLATTKSSVVKRLAEQISELLNKVNVAESVPLVDSKKKRKLEDSTPATVASDGPTITSGKKTKRK